VELLLPYLLPLLVPLLGIIVAIIGESSLSTLAPWWLARLAFLRLGRPRALPLDRAALEALAPAQLSQSPGYRDRTVRRVNLGSLRVAPRLLDDAFRVRAELDRGVLYVWRQAPFFSSNASGYARIKLSLRDDKLVATTRYSVAPFFFLPSWAFVCSLSLFALSLAFLEGVSLSKVVIGLFAMALFGWLGWDIVRRSRSSVERGVEAALAQLFASAQGAAPGQAGEVLMARRDVDVTMPSSAREEVMRPR
jgi:hypothetical protein